MHVHFVVQPVTGATKERFGAYGPALQLRMFQVGETPDPAAVAFAERARPLPAA